MKKCILLLIISFGIFFAGEVKADVFNWFTNGTSVVPTTTLLSWVDVDVSAYIPAGATGVILQVTNSSSSNVAVGFQKNGSTDNRTAVMRSTGLAWVAIGVDANRIFEAYVGGGEITTYLLGYTIDGVTFLDNAVATTVAQAAFRDIDWSVNAPGSLGVILEKASQGGGSWGVRMNGSTDNRISSQSSGNAHFWIIIGVSSTNTMEMYCQYSADCTIYLTGYITSGATFNTNASDYSISATAMWTDLPALPSGATGGFFEAFGGSYNNMGLRSNGSTNNFYRTGGNHTWGFVGSDGSQIVEGIIETVTWDFWLVGYSTAAGATYTPIIIKPGVIFKNNVIFK